MRQSDAARASYLKKVYDIDEESDTDYNVVINTERLTTDAAAAPSSAWSGRPFQALKAVSHRAEQRVGEGGQDRVHLVDLLVGAGSSWAWGELVADPCEQRMGVISRPHRVAPCPVPSTCGTQGFHMVIEDAG